SICLTGTMTRGRFIEAVDCSLDRSFRNLQGRAASVHCARRMALTVSEAQFRRNKIGNDRSGNIIAGIARRRSAPTALFIPVLMLENAHAHDREQTFAFCVEDA